MSNSKCYFAGETEHCPLRIGQNSCSTCESHDYADTVTRAIQDYEGLGSSFTEIFKLFNKIIEQDGKVVELELPVDKVFLVNRVVVALFNDDAERDLEQVIYRRMIYFCFKIMIEEFENEEYDTHENAH